MNASDAYAKIQLFSMEEGEELIWSSIEYNDSFFDPLGSLSATFHPSTIHEEKYMFTHLVKGNILRLFINSRQRALMLIDTVRRTFGRSGTIIEVSCKTPLQTLAEASADPNLHESYPTDLPVEGIINKVISPYGFAVIRVERSDYLKQLTGIDREIGEAILVKDLKQKEVQVKDGETVLNFVSRIYNKLGLVVRHDSTAYHGGDGDVPPFGTILICRPDYQQVSSYDMVYERAPTSRGPTVGAVDRFLDDLTITWTNTGVYSEVVVRGQGKSSKKQKRASQPIGRVKMENEPGLTVIGIDESDAAFVDVSFETIDYNYHSYRAPWAPYKPLFVLNKRARDNKQCVSFAKIMHAKGGRGSYVVQGTVDGITSMSAGGPWAPNTIANVWIEGTELEGQQLWISEAGFQADRKGGQRSMLKLIPLWSAIIGDLPS